MASWALWQALPPRFQLTCKDNHGEEAINHPASCPSPRTPRSPRAITPRQGSARSRVKSAHPSLGLRGNSGDKRSKATKENQHDRKTGTKYPTQEPSPSMSPRDRSHVTTLQENCVDVDNGSSRPERQEADFSHCIHGQVNGQVDGRGSRKVNGELVERVNGELDRKERESLKIKVKRDEEDGSKNSNSRQKATMYFTVSSPRGKPSDYNTFSAITQSAFPSRRSSFINNFKQQQLINSLRNNLDDPSTTSPRSPRKSSKSSNFPVTKMSHEKHNADFSRKFKEKPRAKTAVPASGRPDPRTDQRWSGVGDPTNLEQHLIINTIDPRDTVVRPFLKNPLFHDKTSKRYIVRKLDDATMFIDDNKIIFIKKKATINDVIQNQKSTDDSHYLAHLRKHYLRNPKDIAKFAPNMENPKKALMRERLEYDQRTDNILNYYSRIDDRENAFAWAMSVDNANRNDALRGQSGSRSARAHSSPTMRREPTSKPPTPVPDRPATSRSYRATSGGEFYPSQDALSDWNVFVKLNSQSILHDRQFYLQTPMVSPESTAPVNRKAMKRDSCECRLCQLEMEMLLQYQQRQLLAQNEQATVCAAEKENEVGHKSEKVCDLNCQDEVATDPKTFTKERLDEAESFKGEVSLETDGCTDKKEKVSVNLTIDMATQTYDSTEQNVEQSHSSDKNPTTAPNQTTDSSPSETFVVVGGSQVGSFGHQEIMGCDVDERGS